jgi:hypothetical protein
MQKLPNFGRWKKIKFGGKFSADLTILPFLENTWKYLEFLVE